ncbi:MAG: zinc-ribbon domain-containing protein, partial [Acidimicrobiia bacterium]
MASRPVRCINCGTPLEPGAPACTHCGTPVSDADGPMTAEIVDEPTTGSGG